MKRTTVISRKAKVRAPSAVDCGESEDSYAEDQSGTASPALLVVSIKFSGVTAGSGDGDPDLRHDA